MRVLGFFTFLMAALLLAPPALPGDREWDRHHLTEQELLARMERLEQKFAALQTDEDFAGNPGLLSKILEGKALLERAGEAAQSGDMRKGKYLMSRAEALLMDLFRIGHDMQRHDSESGKSGDGRRERDHDSRLQEERYQLEKAKRRLEEVQHKLDLSSSVASELHQKITLYLSRAGAALAQGDGAATRHWVAQAEILFPEIFALAESRHDGEGADGGRDMYRRRKFTDGGEHARAAERYERVRDRFHRLKDRDGRKGRDQDPRLDRIGEDLRKAEEALSMNQAENSTQFSARAENQMAQLLGGSQTADDLPPEAGARNERERAGQRHRRITQKLERLLDEAGREGALRSRLEEIRAGLDKAESALTAGQVDKAHAILDGAERRMAAMAAPGAPASDAGARTGRLLEAVERKMEMARGIVARSRNAKASNLLEKAAAHYDKARTHHGLNPGRFQVELEICLKLMAKAVDISQAASR